MKTVEGVWEDDRVRETNFSIDELDEPIGQTLVLLFLTSTASGRPDDGNKSLSCTNSTQRKGQKCSSRLGFMGTADYFAHTCYVMLFLISSLLALGVCGGEETDSARSPVMFASVFILVWIGSGAVTINAVLLGGRV